jgi:SAM-dependent methyltransferase
MRWRRGSKAHHELGFWRERLAAEGGRLENRHYEHFFTTWFGLDADFYAGRRILDVGCGPRGSLEWASMAARRAGLDPLADAYRAELGAGAHGMEYLAAGAEDIPAEDDAFDVVTSFNALDHVDDVGRAAAEILRVLAPGGTLLLATDVNHEPTPMEPQTFGTEVMDHFVPPLAVAERRDLERHEGGLFAGMLQNAPYDMTRPGRPAVLVARLQAPDG